MSQSDRFLGRMGKLSPEADSPIVRGRFPVAVLDLLEGGRQEQGPFERPVPQRTDLLQVFGSCDSIPTCCANVLLGWCD